jgi:hypothetical protein
MRLRTSLPCPILALIWGIEKAALSRRANANRGPNHKENGLPMAEKNPMVGGAGGDSNSRNVIARRSDG